MEAHFDRTVCLEDALQYERDALLLGPSGYPSSFAERSRSDAFATKRFIAAINGGGLVTAVSAAGEGSLVAPDATGRRLPVPVPAALAPVVGDLWLPPPEGSATAAWALLAPSRHHCEAEQRRLQETQTTAAKAAPLLGSPALIEAALEASSAFLAEARATLPGMPLAQLLAGARRQGWARLLDFHPGVTPKADPALPAVLLTLHRLWQGAPEAAQWTPAAPPALEVTPLLQRVLAFYVAAFTWLNAVLPDLGAATGLHATARALLLDLAASPLLCVGAPLLLLFFREEAPPVDPPQPGRKPRHPLAGGFLATVLLPLLKLTAAAVEEAPLLCGVDPLMRPEGKAYSAATHGLAYVLAVLSGCRAARGSQGWPAPGQELLTDAAVRGMARSFRRCRSAAAAALLTAAVVPAAAFPTHTGDAEDADADPRLDETRAARWVADSYRDLPRTEAAQLDCAIARRDAFGTLAKAATAAQRALGQTDDCSAEPAALSAEEEHALREGMEARGVWIANIEAASTIAPRLCTELPPAFGLARPHIVTATDGVPGDRQLLVSVSGAATARPPGDALGVLLVRAGGSWWSFHVLCPVASTTCDSLGRDVVTAFLLQHDAPLLSALLSAISRPGDARLLLHSAAQDDARNGGGLARWVGLQQSLARLSAARDGGEYGVAAPLWWAQSAAGQAGKTRNDTAAAAVEAPVARMLHGRLDDAARMMGAALGSPAMEAFPLAALPGAFRDLSAPQHEAASCAVRAAGTPCAEVDPAARDGRPAQLIVRGGTASGKSSVAVVTTATIAAARLQARKTGCNSAVVARAGAAKKSFEASAHENALAAAPTPASMATERARGAAARSCQESLATLRRSQAVTGAVVFAAPSGAAAQANADTAAVAAGLTDPSALQQRQGALPTLDELAVSALQRATRSPGYLGLEAQFRAAAAALAEVDALLRRPHITGGAASQLLSPQQWAELLKGAEGGLDVPGLLRAAFEESFRSVQPSDLDEDVALQSAEDIAGIAELCLSDGAVPAAPPLPTAGLDEGNAAGEPGGKVFSHRSLDAMSGRDLFDYGEQLRRRLCRRLVAARRALWAELWRIDAAVLDTAQAVLISQLNTAAKPIVAAGGDHLLRHAAVLFHTNPSAVVLDDSDFFPQAPLSGPAFAAHPTLRCRWRYAMCLLTTNERTALKPDSIWCGTGPSTRPFCTTVAKSVWARWSQSVALGSDHLRCASPDVIAATNALACTGGAIRVDTAAPAASVHVPGLGGSAFVLAINDGWLRRCAVSPVEPPTDLAACRAAHLVAEEIRGHGCSVTVVGVHADGSAAEPGLLRVLAARLAREEQNAPHSGTARPAAAVWSRMEQRGSSAVDVSVVVVLMRGAEGCGTAPTALKEPRAMWRAASASRRGLVVVCPHSVLLASPPLAGCCVVSAAILAHRRGAWLLHDAEALRGGTAQLGPGLALPALPLECPRHHKTRAALVVETVAALDGEDATVACKKLAPPACGALCMERFAECTEKTHVCLEPCHTADHARCPFPCTRPRECGHPCLKDCGDDCGPCELTTYHPLSCGAEVVVGFANDAPELSTVPHYQLRRCCDPELPCTQEVERRCPHCFAPYTAVCSEPPLDQCADCAKAEADALAASGETAEEMSEDTAAAISAARQPDALRHGLMLKRIALVASKNGPAANPRYAAETAIAEAAEKHRAAAAAELTAQTAQRREEAKGHMRAALQGQLAHKADNEVHAKFVCAAVAKERNLLQTDK